MVVFFPFIVRQAAHPVLKRGANEKLTDFRRSSNTH